MAFELLRSARTSSARLGRLSVPRLGGSAGRAALDTPTYLAVTSRGAVPHLTPDMVARHTSFAGAYFAYEDFLDQARSERPPVQRTPLRPCSPSSPTPRGKARGSTRLHEFASMPRDRLIVLGTRRAPPLAAPRSMGSGGKTASVVCTATGFRPLENATFARAVTELTPDIAIPMAALPPSSGASSLEEPPTATVKTTPSAKRAERMVDRTGEWTEQFLATLDSLQTQTVAVFAPVLPLPAAVQWDWLSRLSDDLLSGVSGLALHDVSIIPDLADYMPLVPLPRLSLDFPSTPHHVLRHVALGVDLFLLPFVSAASDVGVALSFEFPPPSDGSAMPGPGAGTLPLGIDLRGEEHATDLGPLVEGCTCYACSHHHRAYVRHLLSAREMLAWTLLQVHNHAVVDCFFHSVRRVLAEEGPERFEELIAKFAARYEPEIPVGSGTRPRARGYHFKTEPGAGGLPPQRINPPAWQNMNADAGAGEQEVDVAEVEKEEVMAEELVSHGVLEMQDEVVTNVKV